MAEPVSITAGVLTMLRVSLSAVGTLKSATATPSEFARLERELEHFGDIISDVDKVANDRKQMTDSLTKNMNNARLKVQEINDFFGTRMYRKDSESLKVRRTALIKETSRLRSFAKDIETIKARLVDCLAISNLSNKLHESFHSGPSDRISSSHSPPILESETEGQNTSPGSQLETLQHIDIAQQSCEVSEGPRTDLRPSSSSTSIQNTPINVDQHRQVSHEQTLNTVASLVRETQHAMILNDNSLGEHIAQIFRELSTNRLQMQHLTETLSVNERKWRRRWRRLSKGGHRVLDRETSDDYSAHSLSERSESEATIFFDCISRFSETDSEISLERLQTKFSGSPDYFLETGSTFLPERYNLDNIFDGAVTFVAINSLQLTSPHRAFKAFLFYSRTPRTWQKVTVTATVVSSCQRSVFSGAVWADTGMVGAFPMQRDLENQMRSVLKSKPLLETVTSLSLTIAEDSFGKITVDTSSTVVEEDLDESQMIDEQRVLQDIDDIGCPQFLESEVIVLRRRAVYEYVVHVESQKCVETKVPFGRAGLPGDNKLRDFINCLKQRFILQGCKNVTKFIGVVLDDSRKHLRSYLTETLPIPSLCWMFIGAEEEGKQIPWSIRELWAKQIVDGVSDIHAKGIAMGGFTLRKGISIRADGSVVLEPTFPLRSSHWFHTHAHGDGWLSPEIQMESRNIPWSERITTFRQDLFYLGLVLWLIAQHKWTVIGLFCTINACSNWPRHYCTAAHTNPLELPRCGGVEVPEYFDSIIGHCRRAEPSARLPARALLRFFDDKDPPPGTAELLRDLVKKYNHENGNRTVNCDECGSLIKRVCFRCSLCDGGGFDLCLDCFTSGVPCYVPEHQLQKVEVES